MKNSFYKLLKGILAILISSAIWISCGDKGQTTQQEPPKETPAPSAPTAPTLNFEHFGNYDLTGWEKVPLQREAPEESGDVIPTSIGFKKDGMTLEIDTAKSEYYYGLTYTLKNSEGNVLKSRELIYSNDPQQISEVIKDFTVSPGKLFSRVQNTDKSWQEGAIPASATGAWVESPALLIVSCDEKGKMTFDGKVMKNNAALKKAILPILDDLTKKGARELPEIKTEGCTMGISGAIRDLFEELLEEVFANNPTY